MEPTPPPNLNTLSLEEDAINASSTKMEVEGENGTENIVTDQNEIRSGVHPHHWCGQHKFEADSPTNIYDYTSQRDRQKSAMCRVAEIARFNKLKHIYDLQDESGPAHKKLFTVKLVLTEEEVYEGSGPSIKRAQQAAAEAALQNTKLAKPSERHSRKRKTPEIAKPHRVLQSMCRSLGYPSPNYIVCNPPCFPDPPPLLIPQHIVLPPPTMNLYQQPVTFFPIDPAVRPHGPKLQAVIVNIDGKSVATGIGENYPAAKCDAAAKALAVLGPLLSEQQSAPTEKLPTPESSPIKQKSVISDIHEKAHQLKVNVVFETLKEEGPPHDRHYLVRCAFVTSNQEVKAEAVGKGKKKKAAQQEACTHLLKSLEPLSPEANLVSFASSVCKAQKKLIYSQNKDKEPKRKTIMKDKKMDPLYGHQINPVSRLIQVTQAKTQENPTFELIAEHGVSKFKEFVIKVEYGNVVREGKGPNKRLAKRAAAEAMLDHIGFVKPLPPPGKSLLKKVSETHDPSGMPIISHWTGPPPEKIEPPVEAKISEKPAESTTKSSSIETKNEKQEDSPEEKRRVTFNCEVHACPPPGDHNYPKSYIQSLKKDAIVEGKIRKLKRSKENRRALTTEQMKDLSEKAETFLDSRKKEICTTQHNPTAHSYLDKLSEFFKFTVQYTSFPQVGIDQQFTIVSLGLEAPLVGHGVGPTTCHADEEAALDAIKKLRDLAQNALSGPSSPLSSPTPT